MTKFSVGNGLPDQGSAWKMLLLLGPWSVRHSLFVPETFQIRTSPSSWRRCPLSGTSAKSGSSNRGSPKAWTAHVAFPKNEFQWKPNYYSGSILVLKQTVLFWRREDICNGANKFSEFWMNKFPCLIHENCNTELIIDYHCHILATIPSKCASEKVPGPLNPWKEKEMAVQKNKKN